MPNAHNGAAGMVFLWENCWRVRFGNGAVSQVEFWCPWCQKALVWSAFVIAQEFLCYSLARCVCDDPIEGKICSYVDNSFIQLLFDGSLPSGESFWYVFSDLLLTDAESFLVVTIDFWSIYAADY